MGRRESRYGDLVKEFPAFPNIHYAFGRFLLAVEDTDAAIQQFKEEIQNNSRHVRARMQIAANYRVDSAAGHPVRTGGCQARTGLPVRPLPPRAPVSRYARPHSLDSGARTAARMVPKEPHIDPIGSAYARAGRPQDAARARAAFARLGGTNSPSGPGSMSEQPRLDPDRSP